MRARARKTLECQLSCWPGVASQRLQKVPFTLLEQCSLLAFPQQHRSLSPYMRLRHG